MKRLEAALMETRLLPISSVFGRFPGWCATWRGGEGSGSALVTSGGETPLDKAVLDRLGEPLVHLLTNAVVHGIETPAERRRGGQARRRACCASAPRPDSGRVVIRLADDGRGLDERRILAKAEALGLDLSRRTRAISRALIFLPGFSTAEQVSDAGGARRGTGRRGGGDPRARRHHRGREPAGPGQSRFILGLPLTLAIVRSLIVEVDRERYAVPISHVAETVRVEPQARSTRSTSRAWRSGGASSSRSTDGGALLGTGAAADRGAPLLRRDQLRAAGGGGFWWTA